MAENAKLKAAATVRKPVPWAERTFSHDEIKADSKIGTGSLERLDGQGTLRRIYLQDLPVVFPVLQPRPKIGGRNIFLCQPGIYILASEEGSFRALACTQANAGFVEILDWKLVPDENLDEPLEYKAEGTPKVILRMSPPILGQWPLDANFQNGLVVKISGGHAFAYLTVVWFLASDIGNGK